jgi:hypothetical protein
MAKDGLGTVVGLAAGAGILWYAYSSGWLSAFGIGPTVAAPATVPVTAPPTEPVASGAGTNPVTTAPTATTTTPPAATGPCPLTGVLAPALALAQRQQGWSDPNAPTSVLSMDQWNYFLGQVCTNLSTQLGDKLDPGAIFPNDPNRGGPINWLAYKGYATAAGLSGFRPMAGSGMGTRLARRRA